MSTTLEHASAESMRLNSERVKREAAKPVGPVTAASLVMATSKVRLVTARDVETEGGVWTWGAPVKTGNVDGGKYTFPDGSTGHFSKDRPGKEARHYAFLAL